MNLREKRNLFKEEVGSVENTIKPGDNEEKLKESVDDYLQFFDTTKTNIVLIEDAELIYQFYLGLNQQISNLKLIKNGGVKIPTVMSLPSPFYHHTRYELHFKGAVNEFENPIIFTQSKEFLETILQIELNPDKDLRNFDFNVVLVYRDPDKKDDIKSFIVDTFEKQGAKEVMIDNNYDLRDMEERTLLLKAIKDIEEGLKNGL